MNQEQLMRKRVSETPQVVSERMQSFKPLNVKEAEQEPLYTPEQVSAILVRASFYDAREKARGEEAIKRSEIEKQLSTRSIYDGLIGQSTLYEVGQQLMGVSPKSIASAIQSSSPSREKILEKLVKSDIPMTKSVARQLLKERSNNFRTGFYNNVSQETLKILEDAFPDQQFVIEKNNQVNLRVALFGFGVPILGWALVGLSYWAQQMPRVTTPTIKVYAMKNEEGRQRKVNIASIEFEEKYGQDSSDFHLDVNIKHPSFLQAYASWENQMALLIKKENTWPGGETNQIFIRKRYSANV